MRRTKKEETPVNKTIVEKKKSKLPGWAIALIICVVLGIIIYFVCIFGFLGFALFIDSENSDIEYESKGDNTYYSEKINTTIEESSAEYDEKDACYVITLKVERNGEIKKNFMENSQLEISYKMYDKDGYLLGTADGYADNFSEDNKWKVKVQYCESDADEVSSYKMNKISTY